jgi:Flp pilus assembly protein TadB
MASQQRKAPADERREGLERELERLQELQRASEKPVVEATAWYLSTFALVTTALVLIAGVTVLIVLLAT